MKRLAVLRLAGLDVVYAKETHSPSERDAWWHIMEWQIPAALLFFVLGTLWCVFSRRFIPEKCSQVQEMSFVIIFVLICWFITSTSLLLIVDMLLLPPPLFTLLSLLHRL